MDPLPLRTPRLSHRGFWRSQPTERCGEEVSEERCLAIRGAISTSAQRTLSSSLGSLPVPESTIRTWAGRLAPEVTRRRSSASPCSERPRSPGLGSTPYAGGLAVATRRRILVIATADSCAPRITTDVLADDDRLFRSFDDDPVVVVHNRNCKERGATGQASGGGRRRRRGWHLFPGTPSPAETGGLSSSRRRRRGSRRG